MTHIRARMPRKGGNSFYRDKNDYSADVKTLCGAPVTDKDVDYATANTKKFRASGWPVCSGCLETLNAQVMREARTQGEHEVVIISADRPVEYGTLDGNTIKVRS